MSFHVGQRVVCVDDDFGPHSSHPKLSGVHWPQRGAVYTIRAMDFIAASYGEGTVLWFHEITNPVVKFRDLPPMEVAFVAKFFRPVKTTSIEIFRQMLVTPPREVVDA